MQFRYSPEQLEWLRENYKILRRTELTAAFNREFNMNQKLTQICGCLKNHRITSGRTGHFKKGGKAWNLGQKGYMGANKTSFKKGGTPPNTNPIGAERVDKDGYIWIKVAERNPHTGGPTRYRMKHAVEWEKKFGPKPKDMVLLFKDGNKQNCHPDNIECITRHEHLYLNNHKHSELPPELKPTLRALAKVEVKLCSLR